MPIHVAADAVFPAELAGVSHEDDGGEVARAECERGEPRPHVAAAQNEPVDGAGVSSAVDADAHRHADENEHHAYLFDHGSIPIVSCEPTTRRSLSVGIEPLASRSVSRETLATASCDKGTDVSRETMRRERALAVAHMTLPAAGAPCRDAARTQHHGQTHVLEVSIGIIRKGAVDGTAVRRSRTACGERRQALGRPRREGAQRSRNGELELPALFSVSMYLLGMHRLTLP